MGTYSFLSIQASLTGPGGNISLGSGAGSAEEGISVEMIEEKDLMTVGADGAIMHTLRASNAARISIRLLKTSPVNAQLSDLYNFQRQSPGNWGQNTLVVSDTVRGDLVSGSQIAFARQPQLTYAKDAGMNEWIFYGNVNEALGTGSPSVN
jgi:predicted SPOUT superfamily RNA methylase MTH1